MLQTKTYVIQMRDGSHFPVTAAQAAVIDQAWVKRAPVKIGDMRINTVDLTGVWPLADWYNMHPNDRPDRVVAEPSVFAQLMTGKEAETGELSTVGQLWFKAMRQNFKELHDHKRYGKWIVRNGEIIETT